MFSQYEIFFLECYKTEAESPHVSSLGDSELTLTSSYWNDLWTVQLQSSCVTLKGNPL